jgi:pimeloyl-ACP methyl ester carboxylesterase
MRTAVLDVPGARLYHEIRGDGPVLVLIPGGPMDAGGFTALAEELEDRYTVVTYDCRGNSRSPHDGAVEELTVELFAEDARRLIEAIASEPARVLGSSGGAIYSLELVARHPEAVRALVAHEPPVSTLLPDAGHWRALNLEVGEVSRSGGTFAAIERFGQETGLGGGSSPSEDPTPEEQEAGARMMGNLDLFAGQLIPAVGNYEPDIEALRAGGTPIAIGVGEASTDDQVPARSARALAERLGLEPLRFPGDHGGFASHPEEFGATLVAAFAALDGAG